MEKKNAGPNRIVVIRKEPDTDFRIYPQNRNPLNCFIPQKRVYCLVVVVDLVAVVDLPVVDFVAA